MPHSTPVLDGALLDGRYRLGGPIGRGGMSVVLGVDYMIMERCRAKIWLREPPVKRRLRAGEPRAEDFCSA